MNTKELKMQAEAAKLALALQGNGCTFLFVSGWGEHRECDAAKALCAFSSAANPVAVLELIAENERLAVLLDDYKQGAQAEADGGDAARAEARLLRAELRSIWEKEGIPCRPFLFSFTEDRIGCTVDFDGEPYHYTELDRFLETAAERDQLRAENETLRGALREIFNHVEGNTEELVRQLVNWGTPRVDPNDFYAECEAIKAIASVALLGEAASIPDDMKG